MINLKYKYSYFYYYFKLLAAFCFIFNAWAYLLHFPHLVTERVPRFECQLWHWQIMEFCACYFNLWVFHVYMSRNNTNIAERIIVWVKWNNTWKAWWHIASTQYTFISFPSFPQNRFYCQCKFLKNLWNSGKFHEGAFLFL